MNLFNMVYAVFDCSPHERRRWGGPRRVLTTYSAEEAISRAEGYMTVLPEMKQRYVVVKTLGDGAIEILWDSDKDYKPKEKVS